MKQQTEQPKWEKWDMPDEHWVVGPFGVYPASTAEEAAKVRRLSGVALLLISLCAAGGIVWLVAMAMSS